VGARTPFSSAATAEDNPPRAAKQKRPIRLLPWWFIVTNDQLLDAASRAQTLERGAVGTKPALTAKWLKAFREGRPTLI
jgi:hypothetical protein